MAGFYDLNIVVENDAAFGPVHQAEMSNALIKFGYDAVAYNVIATPPLDKRHKCAIEHCEYINESEPLDKKKLNDQRRKGSCALRLDGKSFRQLTRITVILDDSNWQYFDGCTSITNTYDLLAVRPTTERSFEMCCKLASADIISIDLSLRLPFHLRIQEIKTAIDRGLYLEISYSTALKDSAARRQMLSNATMLVRAARGRNIIFSSGAARVMEVRGVGDVCNLGHLMGITSHPVARACLQKNCQAVIESSLIRRGLSHSAAKVSKLKDSDLWKLPSAVAALCAAVALDNAAALNQHTHDRKRPRDADPDAGGVAGAAAAARKT